MTSRELEAIWLPIAGISLILGFVAFCITAFYTQNGLWAIGAVACWALLAARQR